MGELNLVSGLVVLASAGYVVTGYLCWRDYGPLGLIPGALVIAGAALFALAQI